jgi:hypothetical protein
MDSLNSTQINVSSPYLINYTITTISLQNLNVDIKNSTAIIDVAFFDEQNINIRTQTIQLDYNTVINFDAIKTSVSEILKLN